MPTASDGARTERVLWPRGRKTVGVRPLAKRLDTLEGKTIGELWDYLFRGDEIFPVLERELGRRWRGLRFVDYEVFGSTHGSDERKVLAELGVVLDLDPTGVARISAGVGLSHSAHNETRPSSLLPAAQCGEPAESIL